MDIIGNSANGDNIFLHDMVVKEIGGVQTMLVSYWDAGYLKLNVNDPANPVIIGDMDFGMKDPLVVDPRTGEGFERPEGNAHEAEFSHDNRFVLAADEDFSAFRAGSFTIDERPECGRVRVAGRAGRRRPVDPAGPGAERPGRLRRIRLPAGSDAERPGRGHRVPARVARRG